MHLKIAIADDVADDRRKLSEDLADYFRNTENLSCDIKTFISAEELLAGFLPGAYDIIFLDIVMDGMDGVSCAKRIRLTDKNVTLVFLTSSKEYALDAYPAHPFDYLIKPVDSPALHRVLTEMITLRTVPEPEITVRIARGTLNIPLRNILAVNAHGHVVEIRMANGQIVKSTASFRELSAALSGHPRFLVCNRCVLVNMDYATSLIGDDIRMNDNTVYPLRINGRRAVVSQFSQYMVTRMEKGGR